MERYDSDEDDPSKLKNPQKESPPEFLSWSARNGKFEPFQDESIAEHLGIKNSQKIHILDMEIGTWVTHFQNSPPVNVNTRSTVHMKGCGTNIDPKSAISATQTKKVVKEEVGMQSNKRKVAKLEGHDEIIDLTTSDIHSPKKMKAIPEVEVEDTHGILNAISRPSSPLQPYVSNDDAVDVGSRPVRLSTFPARTVGQMVPRIEWIVSQDQSSATVKARFLKMFSCEYRKTTYYRHQSAWKWLRDNSVLDESKESDLWAPLVRAATSAMKAEKDEGDVAEVNRSESVEL